MSESSQKTLRFMQFNAENLFLFLDKYECEDLTQLDERQWQQLSIASVKNKPIKKARWLAETIVQQSPDIVFLNEVGGPDSLKAFNTYFLSGAYRCYLKEGNSDRGIDVGYLVKKSLPFQILHLSHRFRPIHFNYAHEINSSRSYASHLFSRDVSELRLFDPNSGELWLVILGVHLKSKLDKEGIDPGGTLRRQAEFNTLLKIYTDIQSETDSNTSVIVAGDFNGQARASNPDPEFTSIRNTDLKDIFELANIPEKERTTQVQVQTGAKPIPRQIDYIFLSQSLHKNIVSGSAKVVLFKNEMGIEIDHPETPAQRFELPSDHCPVQVDLKLEKPT